MKKVIIIFCMLLFAFSTNVFSQALQEVRGVETRCVLDKSKSQDHRAECQKDYNVEFTNQNSFAISVTAELWDAYNKQIIQTKDFVLDPKEKYEWSLKLQKGSNEELERNHRTCYVKYKAYKLQ